MVDRRLVDLVPMVVGYFIQWRASSQVTATLSLRSPSTAARKRSWSRAVGRTSRRHGLLMAAPSSSSAIARRTLGFGRFRVANGKPIGAPELLRGERRSDSGLGFSRDGSFFYGRMNAQDDVFAADLDPATAAITSKPAPLIDRSMGSNRGASWSPDQRRLAFVRSTPSGDAVVVRSADGTERTLPTRFRDGGYRFAVPVWFPDGRSLLIPEIDRSIRRSTYRRVQIDTMEETVALEGPNWEMRRPTGPSPDGTAIYYSKGQEFAPDGRNWCGWCAAISRRGRKRSCTEPTTFRAARLSSPHRFHLTASDWRSWPSMTAREPTLMTVPSGRRRSGTPARAWQVPSRTRGSRSDPPVDERRSFHPRGEL